MLGASGHVDLVVAGAGAADDNQVAGGRRQRRAPQPRSQHDQSGNAGQIVGRHFERVEALPVGRVAGRGRLPRQEMKRDVRAQASSSSRKSP